MKKENIKEAILNNRDFFDSRTEFWKTIVYCLSVSSFIGLPLWILFSNDFIVLDWWYSKNSVQKIKLSLLFNFSFFLFSLSISILFYYLKWIKEDLIIYSCSFNSFIITNNMNSYWLPFTSNISVFIRIIIAFAIAFAILFISIFLTGFMKNSMLKFEEYNERLVKEYNDGLVLTTKKGFRIEKKILAINKRKQKQKQKQLIEEEAEKIRKADLESKIEDIKKRITDKDNNKIKKEKTKKSKNNKIKF
ncbi:DxFTY motif-containing membrane protein [Spiroplasma endosymbiont of Aspidapion aeneum]|uniref:DxFTY motif-containing membrane protein n=1 Tax=Spiroplasma endosymbiont of Aspidapion aeneum TaxID=3066276 RepID=UPI00313C4FED